MNFKNIIYLLSALLIAGCSSDEKTKVNSEPLAKPSHEKLNISILLDLSDRIDTKKHPNPGMEFYQRDLGYIESISKAFERHLSSKPIIRDDDYIQVYFEPEPLNPEINKLAKKLKLSFTKSNTTRETIREITPQYKSAVTEIYKLAMQDSHYVGSDIWGFFKSKVKDYCIKSNHRNILFILTDGYIYHKDSKFSGEGKTSYLTPELIRSLQLNTSDYEEIIEKNKLGYIKATGDLDELEVVVLGIQPMKGNPFEGDVIHTYWNNWFKEMKVKNAGMTPISADLPSNVDPLIQKFINH